VSKDKPELASEKDFTPLGRKKFKSSLKSSNSSLKLEEQEYSMEKQKRKLEDKSTKTLKGKDYKRESLIKKQTGVHLETEEEKKV
jgi:hypothetical protein